MDHQHKATITKWKAGEISGGSEDGYAVNKAIRRYMLDKAGHKCERCGWNQINPVTQKCPLTLDHVDGNAGNNSEENLRVLCPNCHSLTATYMVLNRGNGRPTRRARDLKYRIAVGQV